MFIIKDTQTQREFSVNINKIREFDKFTFIKNISESTIDDSVDKNVEILKGISPYQKGESLAIQKQDAVDIEPNDDQEEAGIRINQYNNLPDPTSKSSQFHRHKKGYTLLNKKSCQT